MIANRGLQTYTPEMGEKRPIAQMEASLAYYGKHYFVSTPLELKGRGIRFIKKYDEMTFTNGAKNRKVGWNSYQVTLNAFDKLENQYSISMKVLLD